jgi:RTX calcium-binding nonapeptide repeat (4 copies)
MFESLEKRQLMSAAVLSAGTLTVTGTLNGDKITITRVVQTDKTIIQVNVNGAIQKFNAKNVKHIAVDGGIAGDDLIAVTIGKGGPNATINGGLGDDSLIGSSQRDLINGGDGNDSLFGLGGNDTLIGGTGDDTMVGGAGADSIDGTDGGTGNGDANDIALTDADDTVKNVRSQETLASLSHLNPRDMTITATAVQDSQRHVFLTVTVNARNGSVISPIRYVRKVANKFVFTITILAPPFTGTKTGATRQQVFDLGKQDVGTYNVAVWEEVGNVPLTATFTVTNPTPLPQ